MFRIIALAACGLSLALGAPARADDDGDPGPAHAILFYLPNRLFDVMDVVRARVRLGSGFAISARATEIADFFVGGYSGMYVGMPGPRGEPEAHWPIGAESRHGVEISVVDDTPETASEPYYGPAEAGAGFHLLILGVEIGVAPLEILDLIGGFFLLDLTDDDL